MPRKSLKLREIDSAQLNPSSKNPRAFSDAGFRVTPWSMERSPFLKIIVTLLFNRNGKEK
jgi:hypothetical protein